MNNNFSYYGGKDITDHEILKEIKFINDAQNAQDNQNDILYHDDLRINGEIKCIMPNQTIKISLKDPLGKVGGEGATFTTNVDGLVAKLYNIKKLTKVQEEKLCFMVNNPIDDSRLCWPKGILKFNGKFVGIVMPYIKCDGYNIHQNEDIYIHPEWSDYSTKEFSKVFNNNQKNIVKSLISTMEIFEKLKNHNIVVGDFGFDNIFINQKTFEVVLIDLDSVQIGKYPSLLCKKKWNAPEILQGSSGLNNDNDDLIALQYYHKIYSTFHRDAYSLAVFAFSLLIRRDPYVNIDACVNYEFLFDPINEKLTVNHYGESVSNIWAHLPYFIREAFHKCFTTKNPNERLTPKQWKELFKYYLNILENGQLEQLDKGCYKCYNSDYISFSSLENVKMIYKKRFDSVGFTMKDAIRKLLINSNNVVLNESIDIISEYLKHHKVLKINNCTFKVLFNIGVFKKLSLESVGS